VRDTSANRSKANKKPASPKRQPKSVGKEYKKIDS